MVQSRRHSERKGNQKRKSCQEPPGLRCIFPKAHLPALTSPFPSEDALSINLENARIRCVHTPTARLSFIRKWARVGVGILILCVKIAIWVYRMLVFPSYVQLPWVSLIDEKWKEALHICIRSKRRYKTWIFESHLFLPIYFTSSISTKLHEPKHFLNNFAPLDSTYVNSAQLTNSRQVRS